MSASVSRRDFARLFAVGGSAALFADPVWARQQGAFALPGKLVIPGQTGTLALPQLVGRVCCTPLPARGRVGLQTQQGQGFGRLLGQPGGL